MVFPHVRGGEALACLRDTLCSQDGDQLRRECHGLAAAFFDLPEYEPAVAALRALPPPPRCPGAGRPRPAGTGPSARPARPAHNGGPTRARSAATRQTGQRPQSPELPPPPPAQPGTAARPPTTRPVPIPASRPMPTAN